MANAMLKIFILITIIAYLEACNLLPNSEYLPVEFSSRQKVLYCTGVGFNGKTLEEHFRKNTSKIRDTFERRDYDLAEVLPKIHAILLFHEQSGGDVKINENGLSGLSNVEFFYIIRTSTVRQVDIHPNAFTHTPKMENLKIQDMSLTENTLQAIRKLRNLKSVFFSGCTPSTGILELIKSTSGLKEITLQMSSKYGANSRPQANAPAPKDVFKNSASTLENLQVIVWPISKLTKNIFNGMNRLERLRWVGDISEIEAGAFDALTNLKELDLKDNQIRRIPADLFKPLTKLRNVNLLNSGMEIRGVENFRASDLAHIRGHNVTVMGFASFDECEKIRNIRCM